MKYQPPSPHFIPLEVSNGVEVEVSPVETIRRIKENFFRGDYQGVAGAAIVELIQVIDENIEFKKHALDVAARGDERIDELTKDLRLLREAFPGPECGDCSCEMSLENHGNMDIYVCSCYEGGCTCFQGHAPCSWCEHVIIADDWMFEHSSEYRSEKRAEKNQAEGIYEENQRITASRLCEEGPSATKAAKPVRPNDVATAAATLPKPKPVMCMQSGDWDGLENL